MWLQEEAVDELDRLCFAPPLPRAPTKTTQIVIDFERTSSGVQHVVSMRLRRNERKEMLTILGIASHARVAPESGSS
jgi:hypothetical protein